VLGTKRQYFRYARVETSHLQKQTPYFQHFPSLNLDAFYLSTRKTRVSAQTYRFLLPPPPQQNKQKQAKKSSLLPLIPKLILQLIPIFVQLK